MYEEVRTQLTTATELSIPTSPVALQTQLNRARQLGRRPRVRMLISLDFEWWEKSSQTILEVGWSLWDTVTQRHRTRHWIIRENLNKVSEGGHNAAVNCRVPGRDTSPEYSTQWGLAAEGPLQPGCVAHVRSCATHQAAVALLQQDLSGYFTMMKCPCWADDFGV